MTGSARVSRTPHKGMARPSLTAQMWGQAGGHPAAGQSHVLGVPVTHMSTSWTHGSSHQAALRTSSQAQGLGQQQLGPQKAPGPFAANGNTEGKRKCWLGMSGDGLWGKHGCRWLCLNPSSHRTGVNSGLNTSEHSQDVCAASASCLCPSTGWSSSVACLSGWEQKWDVRICSLVCSRGSELQQML